MKEYDIYVEARVFILPNSMFTVYSYQSSVYFNLYMGFYGVQCIILMLCFFVILKL